MKLPLPVLLLFFGLEAFSLADEGHCEGRSKEMAVKLKEDLLCGYDRHFPPTYHTAGTTEVTFRMDVLSFDYDTDANTFSINCRIQMSWYDLNLKWKRSDYGGLKNIHVSTGEIWIPDISFYNQNYPGNPGVIPDMNCLLYFDGMVFCTVPANLAASCAADMSTYPFDTQNCTLRFGSWVHSGEEVNFTMAPSPVSVDDMQPNGEWDLVRANATRNPGKLDCCPNDTYPRLLFNFVMKRHSLYGAVTFLIPAIVAMILSLETLWLAPSDPNRIVLMCYNIICHIYFAQSYSWHMQSSGPDASFLMLFIRNSTLVSTITIVLSVVLRNVAQSTSEVPKWVSMVVSVVARKRAGKMLISEYHFEVISSGEKEGTSADVVQENGEPKEWVLLCVIVDRLFFVLFAVVYFFTFIALVP